MNADKPSSVLINSLFRVYLFLKHSLNLPLIKPILSEDAKGAKNVEEAKSNPVPFYRKYN